MTDKKRLQQVLLNLQSNALKFTKSGGSVTIKVYYIKAMNDRKSGMIIRSKSRSSGLIKRVDSYFIGPNPSEADPLEEEPQTKEQSDAQKKRMDEYKERNRRAFAPETKDKIVITVLDTGTGISNKDQKKLFKMFGYLKSTQ